MARVVIATDFGGPEVLSIIDEQSKEPCPGDVRIQGRAPGINPVNWKRYSGTMGSVAPVCPMRVGFGAAGVVASVGEEAIGPAGPIAAGDEVIAYRVDGAYAEETVVPASAVIPKP